LDANRLFNARLLLPTVLLAKRLIGNSMLNISAGIIGIDRVLNYNSKLCRWLNAADTEHGKDAFYSQVFNTRSNYSLS
jgi:hypothetical protein